MILDVVILVIALSVIIGYVSVFIYLINDEEDIQ